MFSSFVSNAFRCHLGKTVLYDTVNQLDWSVSIRAHQIDVVIDLLSEDRNWASKPDNNSVESAVWSNSGDVDKRHDEVGGIQMGKKDKKGTDQGDGKEHLAVPIAKPEEDCIVSCLSHTTALQPQLTLDPQECYKWEYGDFLGPGNE